jgi:MFS family permease
MQEVIGTDAATAGFIFAAFTIGMGITRMVGDSLRMRYSGATLVRGSAVLCALGIGVLLTGSGPLQAGVALAMLGAGVALNAPIGVAVVAKLPGRSTAENMAALSMVALIATFGVPALFGFVAESFGLRTVFAGLVPFLVIGFLLAPVAGRRADR